MFFRTVLISLVFFSVTAFSLEVIPSDYELINHPSPELTIANPFFSIDGQKIKAAKYSLDGQWSENICSVDDRNGNGKTCGEPVLLDPGTHILDIVLCSDTHCSAFGKAWKQSTRFSIAPQEKVIVDLKLLGDLPAGKEDKAFSLTRSKADLSPCGKSVQDAFYTDTCEAAGVKTLLDKMAQMEKVCGATWSKNTDLLFAFALWQTAYLPPTRCYKNEELKKLPPFLVEGTEDDFWPQGTIKNSRSSWSWARSVDDGDDFFKSSGPKYRASAKKAVATWYERQLAVDQLIAAHLNPRKNLEPLLKASQSNPWDFNPSHPIGHRNYAMAASEPLRKHTEVTEALARGSATNEKIHCGFVPEVRRLVDAFLSDGKLSETEWKAIASFVARTPSDVSFEPCSPAFKEAIKSSVSQLDRLKVLGKFDCASSREGNSKGSTLKSLLSPSNSVVPEGIKSQLRAEFPGCTPADHSVDDRWTEIDEYLLPKAAKLSKFCNSKITFEEDRASFAGRGRNEGSGSECTYGLDVVKNMCERWGTKNGPKIKKIICRASKTSTGSGFTEFKKGILFFEVGKDTGFSTDPAEDWLKAAMK
jgi:hypothetical protein